MAMKHKQQKNRFLTDSERELNKSFIATLHKRLGKKQKLVSNSDVAKRYGVR